MFRSSVVRRSFKSLPAPACSLPACLPACSSHLSSLDETNGTATLIRSWENFLNALKRTYRQLKDNGVEVCKRSWKYFLKSLKDAYEKLVARFSSSTSNDSSAGNPSSSDPSPNSDPLPSNKNKASESPVPEPAAKRQKNGVDAEKTGTDVASPVVVDDALPNQESESNVDGNTDSETGMDPSSDNNGSGKRMLCGCSPGAECTCSDNMENKRQRTSSERAFVVTPSASDVSGASSTASSIGSNDVDDSLFGDDVEIVQSPSGNKFANQSANDESTGRGTSLFGEFEANQDSDENTVAPVNADQSSDNEDEHSFGAKNHEMPPLPSYINDIDIVAPCASYLRYKSTICQLEWRKMKLYMNILAKSSSRNNQHERSHDVKCLLCTHISMASIF